jgi:transcriptional regulator with XRE-family HTH domain
MNALQFIGAGIRHDDAELARRLGVHETQVSRDERNEYFSIALERAAKFLDALQVRLRTQVAIEPLPPSPVAQAS